jgi:hypothetical protein
LAAHREKWEKWNIDIKKASELQTQVELLKKEKRQMSSLLGAILSCRAPSPTYFVFLHERYFLFQFRAIAAHKPHNITSPETFLGVYYKSNTEDRNLLCEFYQHNIILTVSRNGIQFPL